MTILQKLILLIMCHLVGDYVLQSNFIASTKGKNWYHFICTLCVILCTVFNCIWMELAIMDHIFNTYDY